MFGPSNCFQRSQFASSSVGVCHLLQSLATAPLAGPSSSMWRGELSRPATMSKDRRGTCARRVTLHLPGCCVTGCCALQARGRTVGPLESRSTRTNARVSRASEPVAQGELTIGPTSETAQCMNTFAVRWALRAIAHDRRAFNCAAS